MALVNVTELNKSFGTHKAVDGVSFSVERGEVLGFLGPNGAGKSTTMKMIAGFLSADHGKVEIDGVAVNKNPRKTKSRLGYLPEGAPLYPDMTPQAFLEFIAQMRGMKGQAVQDAVNNVVEIVNLQTVVNQSIDTLSKGYKRRVGLAQAIIHDPEVLILDEPTDGLDPNQKHEVRNLITQMAPNKAIILSTHILEEVDAVCSRCVVIANGRIKADCSPDELVAKSKWHNAVRISVEGDRANNVVATLSALSDVANVEQLAQSDPNDVHSDFVVYPNTGQSVIAQVTETARTKGWHIRGLNVERGRLDDVFRDITHGQ